MKSYIAIWALALLLVLASAASAETAYTLGKGESIIHNGKTYVLSELVSGQNCRISVDNVLSDVLVVDNIIDGLTITTIGEGYVILEAVVDEPEPILAELRYELSSGDILLFSDTGGINGAMGYVFGETMNPTFLFWAGGRLPTISKTPVPDEKTSLPVGRSYSSQTIWNLNIIVDNIVGDRVIVSIQSDDSISLMKTTVGSQDMTELFQKLLQDLEARLPTAASPGPSVDLTGFLILGFMIAIVPVLKFGIWLTSRWGQYGSD